MVPPDDRALCGGDGGVEPLDPFAGSVGVPAGEAALCDSDVWVDPLCLETPLVEPFAEMVIATDDLALCSDCVVLDPLCLETPLVEPFAGMVVATDNPALCSGGVGLDPLCLETPLVEPFAGMVVATDDSALCGGGDGGGLDPPCLGTLDLFGGIAEAKVVGMDIVLALATAGIGDVVVIFIGKVVSIGAVVACDGQH